MKADAWYYELVGSQMGMAVMEHYTPRMVITHSPPLTSQQPLGCRLAGGGEVGQARKGEAADRTEDLLKLVHSHPGVNQEHKYIRRREGKKYFESFFSPISSPSLPHPSLLTDLHAGVR